MPLTPTSESELMTVAAFIARLERERDAIDEAIRLMRSVARLLDTRAPETAKQVQPKPPPVTPTGNIGDDPGGRGLNWVEARVRFERDGLSCVEIGRLLGCSEQAVYYHRHKEKWKQPSGNGAHP